MFFDVEPHPLDYDWRFVDSTLNYLVSLVGESSCITCGVPSLALRLRGLGREVISVDRNPLRFPDKTIDVSRDMTVDIRSNLIFADPPWYPEEFYRWVTWAAQHAGEGCRILVSIWPNNTRPNAEAERNALLDKISSWAEISIDEGVLGYEVPIFEQQSLRLSGVDHPEIPWRAGDLVTIRPRLRPALAAPIGYSYLWRRFIWDEYQLALKISPSSATVSNIEKLTGLSSWVFPSVSRRAEKRELIGLWSSRNEVASVSCSNVLERDLLNFTSMKGCESNQCESMRYLINSWRIPNRPFERTYTWVHYD